LRGPILFSLPVFPTIFEASSSLKSIGIWGKYEYLLRSFSFLPPGVILGLGTVCELARKYGPLVLGPRTNNLFRRNTSFYVIGTNSAFQRMIKRAACPSDTRCLSWVPGLRNLNARTSQKLSKPRMTPGGR
jgi:hypothetical protein